MPDMDDDDTREDIPDNVRAVWSDDELEQALAALLHGEPVDETAGERSLARARTELMVAAGTREDVPAAEEPSAEPRRRVGWWLASAGTVAAMVASVLVVQTVQSGDDMPSAAAVQQLNMAAERVRTGDEPLGPGEYRYIATRAWWMATLHDNAYLAENLLETWVPANQREDWMWRRDVTGKRKWLSGSEEQLREDGYDIDSMGWPEGEWVAPCGDWFAEEEDREPCARRGSWQSPTQEFLAALPRDTDDLFDRLRRDTRGRGNDPDAEMVGYVADALRTGLVPADLRAALYRVLAEVPGLQITEQVANLDGRTGTAYGISADGERHDVIVDPETGQFIGERRITEDGFEDVPPGTVTTYTSVSTTIVPGMGSRPAG